MNVRRLANKRALTVRGTRKIYDPTLAFLGMLYAKRLGLLRQYQDMLLSKFWTHEAEVDRAENVESALIAAGATADGFRTFATGEQAQELYRIYEEADAQGVFGVPTFVFRAELFWGEDRIGLLRERLAAAALGRTQLMHDGTGEDSKGPGID